MWDYLNTLSELPNCEVLKLKLDACCGEEWISEGVFARLEAQISSPGKLQMIVSLSLSAWCSELALTWKRFLSSLQNFSPQLVGFISKKFNELIVIIS